jgi:hypothetical protein
MVGEYVLSSAHNYDIIAKFAIFFSFPTVRHKRLMAPKESIIRQIIQIDGLAYGSCPITKDRGVQTIVPQSFRPLNTKEKRTLLVEGGGDYYTSY